MTRDERKTKKELISEMAALRQRLSELETERVAAATETGENFRQLAQNMPEAYACHEILLDENEQPIDYVFLEVNDLFEAFTGLRREDIIGKKVTEIIPGIENAEPDLIRIYGETALTGKKTAFDFYFEPFEKWYSVSAYSPRYKFFTALFQDITERVVAEKSLRQNEEKFRLAFQNSPDSINITRLSDGMIVEVNNGFPLITGYTKEEALGRKTSELELWANPKDREKLVAGLQERGTVKNFEFLRKMKDGEKRHTALFASLITFNNEPHLISIIRDIHDQKVAEKALQEARDRLEERVHERTGKIEKLNRGMLAMLEDLKISKEAVEESAQRLQAVNAEMETFTYSVSHDLKAPLRGIDGYSRLLLADYGEQLDEDGRFFLQTIRKATLQMNDLIEDLLLYSRLERRTLQTRPVDLPGLVESLLAEREGELAERGVEMEVALPETAVTADRDGLMMALRNLLDNALKFTRDVSQPVIEIGGRKTESGCIIWVRDNGSGFDMKFHDRIFEIFQRLHRAEEFPGTGIGLAIVHKAMERMNGRAWAESNPGEGAAFFLEIPGET